MLVLVVNSGSSSLKFQLLNMENEEVLSKGLVERIGAGGLATCVMQAKGEKRKVELEIPSHKEAIGFVTDGLVNGDLAVLNNLDEIGAVGHRIVQGGDVFKKATCLDEEAIKIVDQFSEMAPLHNPAALAGIYACQAHMPNTSQVGVFDTAFHNSMDLAHFMYAIDYADYEKYKVRRYGAHGTSHKYVAHELAKALGKDIKDLKLITCHLGNGASITAINGGRVVTTSMGFTPLEGLMMGTRAGDIDAAAVLYLMSRKGLDAQEMDHYLNRECGLLGVSGLSNDFRDIEEAMAKGDKRAQLAYDMFVNKVRLYISGYVGALNGVDGLVFTAGIGENDDLVRASVCADMDYLGIAINEEKNAGCREQRDISADDAHAKVFIIPTNEELAIAREVVDCLGDGPCIKA